MPTALIVEDEPEANHLLAMLVQLRGYRTDSAYTGGEALEKVRSQPPDIVFLDLMLPDINGYEVCKSIKARRTTSLIPVVMVTARIASENRLQSFRVGANDYIPKPYTPDQIFQAMADADAWRRDIENHESEGEVPLETHGDGETLRQLALMRSLLVARSSLDPDSIARIGAAFAEIAADADNWGLVHKIANVGTLAYVIESNHLTVTLRDTSGWLRQDPVPADLRWPKAVPAAKFDEIASHGSGELLTFRKRFDKAEGSGVD
ncbi:Response regulator receiver domain-containing protein [Singulisphaera sp. GP187]|uniref:response regulator transcription factor n=1 Tax=Singulisphaera sp. GP187 TaxID=1882752 RepID=UPI00092B207D|nr:response regulator [Singulisphaera sp. GP187]SIN84958.1 Response regulator receiver domain-containing protein [Singulisphaera sp. GP187]